MAEILGREFQGLQEQRIIAFKQLDEAHKAFLASAPNYETQFDDYKKEVSQVTDKFQSVSKEIIKIKKELDSEYSGTRLGELIGRVQELEEKKLHRVVDYQLAAQQALDNPGDDLCEKNAKLIKQDVDKTCELIMEILTEIRYEIAEIESVSR
eukprot:TRINITY_DN3921_c0_g2_i5.p2 TRINITY_DN3921_c0_g2~~TRINITY_DN3921_c0_g2_i5.p2  ORF type:complete len:171 (+),score=45.71 TRINITY_DN3921_c0_g2_i5:57-515(+)